MTTDQPRGCTSRRPSSASVDGAQVVVLNGPAGVGKTSVGRRLAATARNGVCVHGDDLKRFVVAREPGTVERGLSYVWSGKQRGRVASPSVTK